MAGPSSGDGRRRGVAEIARELDQVGEHAAARRRLDLLHGMALVAADIEAFPGVAGERRSGPPAPAGIALHRLRRAGGEPEQARRKVGLAGHDQPAVGAAQPALDALDGLRREMAGIGHEEKAAALEPGLVEVGFLDQVVLEVAAGEQQAGRVRREIGVSALHPGARQAPGIGEGVGLAAARGLCGIGVATGAAEQQDDVMTGLVGHGAYLPRAAAKGNGRVLPGRFCERTVRSSSYWTTISTRRFCGSRTPSAVGTSRPFSPTPMTVMAVAGTPSRTSASLTALARRSDSAML